MIEEFQNSKNYSLLSTFKRQIIKITIQLFRKSENKFNLRLEPKPKSFYKPVVSFAPIYDSGSSLGRELTESRVNKYLKNDKDLNHYIDRGQAEIHWGGKKVSHFQLIDHINNGFHASYLQTIIQQVKNNFDAEKFKNIINNIDEKVPDKFSQYKIPQNRKELIFKIITLRYKKLCTTTNEGI